MDTGGSQDHEERFMSLPAQLASSGSLHSNDDFGHLIDSHLPFVEKESMDVGFLLTEQQASARYIPSWTGKADKAAKTKSRERRERERPRRPSKRSSFALESAAGSLNLPVIRSLGVRMPPALLSVKVSDNEISSVPEPVGSKNEIVVRIVVHANIPVIEDVGAFSKKAVRSGVPDIWVIEDQKDVDMDDFYATELASFAGAPRLPVPEIRAMRHPLQGRVKIPPPQVGILGIPMDW
jgi:hypothetical protein